MPFNPVWILDVTHRDCLLVQVEGTEGLYCDWRRAVHCPSALPWVVILNVNCYKLWAITSNFMDLLSTASIAHWPQGGFIVHRHDLVTFLQVRIVLITSFNDIEASWPRWLWPGCGCKGRCGSRRLVAMFCWVYGPQSPSCCWSHAAGFWKAFCFFNSLGSYRIEADVLFLHLSHNFDLARHFSLSLSSCFTTELLHWPLLPVLLVGCFLPLVAFLCCIGLTFSWDS